MNTKTLLLTIVSLSAISLFSFTRNNGTIGVYNHFDTKKLTGPAAGKTKAPGEVSCTQCHGGNGTSEVVNSTNLSISFSGASNTYIPGSNYTVTVSLTGSTSPVNGYQIVALRNSDNANIGTWNTTDVNSQIKNLGTRSYVTHTSSGNAFTSWSFDWVAPTNQEGDITFYTAAIISNDNGNDDAGDETHLKQLIIQEDPSSAVIEHDPIVDLDNSLKLSNQDNFISTALISEQTNDVLISVFALNGQVLYSNYEVIVKGKNTLNPIDFNQFPKGIYIIKYKIGNDLISRKVLI